MRKNIKLKTIPNVWLVLWIGMVFTFAMQPASVQAEYSCQNYQNCLQSCNQYCSYPQSNGVQLCPGGGCGPVCTSDYQPCIAVCNTTHPLCTHSNFEKCSAEYMEQMQICATITVNSHNICDDFLEGEDHTGLKLIVSAVGYISGSIMPEMLYNIAMAFQDTPINSYSDCINTLFKMHEMCWVISMSDRAQCAIDFTAALITTNTLLCN